ncbi:hypothetical protein M409DRAFT_62830 [Zasmidium cellare ATCC 36951]|uniref:Cercosporin MFS transporter CTB4 n=1 Tax=Zasmidium cellare ATCC 36951 TaxID=1080233 RepID=A0A6A6D269_ZASCE|nr:uncharacterized protein M409DRAFT_62830 [Zasmidium cellare ATCC 36951]KAF2173275.1 hypothetical protein M409DRAFT_62830 [Zasmidium cellare ATCC 36951]
MNDILRDSTFGQIVRLVSSTRYCRYLEESTDFVLPSKYDYSRRKASDVAIEDQKENNDGSEVDENSNQKSKEDEEDVVIVDWYSENDPENPHNWSRTRKAWTTFVIVLYTFAMFIGSSIYTSSIPDIERTFHVSPVVASLGLSMYVLGYGIGPLIFSPLSEIPACGRNPPYVAGFFLFVILCVPTALVDNFAGLLVLRFLLGFFGSPALATGGASMGDIYSPVSITYAIVLWGACATLGPSLGPIVGNFAVQAETWRWSTWELLWLGGPTWLLMFFSLPDTSSELILLRRARRLRKLTKRIDLRAQSEIRQAHLQPSQVLWNALIKPWEINIKDPAVLFSTIYTALIYGLFYSFFESFPLVYRGIYHWSPGVSGLAFLGVLVGLLIAASSFCLYNYFIGSKMVSKVLKETGSIPPELFLRPGLVATFFIPIGQFIFAWTARPDIHWFPSILGVAVSMIGIFIITQCMFSYLPFTYPIYAGSLFAANNFARAALAAGAILFSTPMFNNLGIDGGVSLLGGLTALCCFGVYGLFFFGERLRKRSKFAQS